MREVRWQVCRVRFLRPAEDEGSRVRRVQLRIVPRALRSLRESGRFGRVLLHRMHADGEGCTSSSTRPRSSWRAIRRPKPRVSPSAFRTHSTPHWTHAHARARPHARAPPLLAARWLSKDRQLRQRQDGSVLRAQKVWIQAEIVAAPGGARSKARRARRARVRIVPSLCTRRARESEVQRVLEQERSNGAYYSEISRRVVLLPQPCENLWIVELLLSLLAAADLPALVPPPTFHNALRASRALLRAHRFTRSASLILQALAAVGARRGLRRWRRRGRRRRGHSAPIWPRQRRQPRHGAGKHLSCATAARLRIARWTAVHHVLVDHGRVVLRQRRAQLEDDLRHR